jgi:hypothetical protein
MLIPIGACRPTIASCPNVGIVNSEEDEADGVRRHGSSDLGMARRWPASTIARTPPQRADSSGELGDDPGSSNVDRRIILSAVAVLTVLAMVGGGTFAVLNAQQEAAGNTLAASELTLAVDKQGTAASSPITVDSATFKPGYVQGDNQAPRYRLRNDGTISGDGYVTFLTDYEGPLLDQVQVTIRRGRIGDSGVCGRAGGNYPFTGSARSANYFQGTAAELLAEGPLQVNTTVAGNENGPLSFAPGAVSCIVVFTEFLDLTTITPGVPGSAEANVQNDAQGETLEFDLLFDLIQN